MDRHRFRNGFLRAVCPAEGPGKESARQSLEMDRAVAALWMGLHECHRRHFGRKDVQKQRWPLLRPKSGSGSWPPADVNSHACGRCTTLRSWRGHPQSLLAPWRLFRFLGLPDMCSCRIPVCGCLGVEPVAQGVLWRDQGHLQSRIRGNRVLRVAVILQGQKEKPQANMDGNWGHAQLLALQHLLNTGDTGQQEAPRIQAASKWAAAAHT